MIVVSAGFAARVGSEARTRTLNSAKQQLVMVRLKLRARLTSGSARYNHKPAMTPTPAFLPMPSPSDADWSQFLELVVANFDCTTGTLHAYDPQDQLLKLKAQRGIPAGLMPIIQSIPIGKGIAGGAAERREPVEMCNLQTDASGVAKPGAKQTQVQGSLAIPVLDGDRLCGTLGIGKTVPYDFTEEEKARLMSIGHDIAARLSEAH
jgi:putative methionine-R-sulfoxide reductase with GAF domain